MCVCVCVCVCVCGGMLELKLCLVVGSSFSDVSLPIATISTAGYRSLLHDLEAQVAIVTDNMELKKAFHSVGLLCCGMCLAGADVTSPSLWHL